MSSDPDFQNEAKLERAEVDRLKFLALRDTVPDPNDWEGRFARGGKHEFGAVDVGLGSLPKFKPLPPYTYATDPATGFTLQQFQDPQYWAFRLKGIEEELDAAKAKKESGKTSPGLEQRIKKGEQLVEISGRYLDEANAQLERQNQIKQLRLIDPNADALASDIEPIAKRYIELQREIWDLQESPNWRFDGKGNYRHDLEGNLREGIRRNALDDKVEGLKKEQATLESSQNLGPKLLKWKRFIDNEGLNSLDWIRHRSTYVLSAPGVAADIAQIAAIAGVGPMKNYDNTGATYTNDEVVEVGGVKRVRSEVEELSAYHPDNAKNHPEISDIDRIDYFRRRGASKEVMSGLPGYEKWKSEQDSKNKIIINPSSVMFKPFFQ